MTAPVGERTFDERARGGSKGSQVAVAKLASRTDVLVSVNLTVPILGERWSPILVLANPAAVIQSGHVALRQTEIGHERKSVLDEDSAPETEFSTGSPTYNQGQNQMYRDCLS